MAVCLFFFSPSRRCGQSVNAVRSYSGAQSIALLLLLVLLFPVISMTDDLAAMNTAAEVEHIMRRYEAPPSQTTSVALLDAIVLVAMAMIGIALSGTRFIPGSPPHLCGEASGWFCTGLRCSAASCSGFSRRLVSLGRIATSSILYKQSPRTQP